MYKNKICFCVDKVILNDSDIFFLSVFLGDILITGTCCNTYSNTRHDITSPRYPNDYNSNEDCEWDIEVPIGKRIELRFVRFRTESSADYLKIYDGRSSSSRQIERLSGSSTPSNTYSSGNRLHLKWDSDTKESGFKIEVRAYGKFCFLHLNI